MLITCLLHFSMFSYPALLFLFLGILLFEAAYAGVTSDAVEAGDALRGVLPPDSQLCGEGTKGRTGSSKSLLQSWQQTTFS